MHPIEFLRYVARSHGGDPVEMAMGAADALSGVTNDMGALMVAARRLVEHHETNAQLWSTCAHAVTSFDPRHELRERSRALSSDPTATFLADAIPDDASVCTIGWSGHVVDALVRRGDVHALVVDSLGDGGDALRFLSNNDSSCELVSPEGVGAAVESADITIISALAVGDNDILACGGSLALASVAYCSQKPVWLVAGDMTRLPAQLFDPMVQGVRDRPDPWASGFDLVSHSLVSALFAPVGGPLDPSHIPALEACPPATELLRRSVI